MKELDELSKVVAKFQKPLRLHDGDVKTILHRFAYLKQKLGEHCTTGVPDVKLVLTSVYCYARTPSNGRKIVGPAKFVSLCNGFGLHFTRKDLWRYEQLYFQHGFYAQAPITNVISYFEAAWYDISKDLNLPEKAKDPILSLLQKTQRLRGQKRAPGIIVGAVIYLVGRNMGIFFTQKELAEYFGVCELSVRQAVHGFERTNAA
jgi:hypothetical protein